MYGYININWNECILILIKMNILAVLVLMKIKV